MQEDIFQNMF